MQIKLGKIDDYILSVVGAVISLQGNWNASTNSPDISGTTTTGYAWRVSVSGSTNIGGITSWVVGDLVVKTATGWLKVDNQDINAVWGNITGTLSNQTDLQSALNTKQESLVSGTNIKTINSNSLLGSGDLVITTSPYGSSGEVQYNDSGIFSSTPYFYFYTSSKILDVVDTLSAEILTNGTFTGSATGWTVGSGWSYSSNTVIHGSNGTATLSQSGVCVLGEEYIFSFTLSNVTVGSVTPTVGGTALTARSTNGTFTERVIASSTNSAVIFTPTNTARFTIDNISLKRYSGGTVRTGLLTIWANNGNSSPSTTRHISLQNKGGNTWIDGVFSGTLRTSIGMNSSGGVDIYTSGGNGFSVYSGNSGLTSNSLLGYWYSSGLVNYGFIAGNGGITAGSTSSPTSTLQNYGGTALKVKRITSNQSLDNTATQILADATTAAACTGTPTYSCSHWANQTDCELYSAHGGCNWNSGNSCSVYNYEYGMGSCSGTSGCSADTNDCSGAYDEYSCTSQNDSYGGSCAWTNSGGDCSGFDESTCGSTSGCTQNYSDCSLLSYPDCTGTSGCSDMGDHCEGSYFSGCSGTYDSYSCTGVYNNGNCSGSYGAGCEGSSTCTGIGNSSDCGNNAGCTWASALTLTLPDGETCADRTYWIYNDSSGGADVIIVPYAGQNVDGTSSYTLSNFKNWIHLAYFKQTESCSTYNESTCNSYSGNGCTPSYDSCSNYYDETACTNANGVCSWNGMSCDGGDFFSYCAGTRVVTKNWYKMGSG